MSHKFIIDMKFLQYHRVLRPLQEIKWTQVPWVEACDVAKDILGSTTAYLKPFIVVDLCCGDGGYGNTLTRDVHDVQMYSVDMHSPEGVTPGAVRVLECDVTDLGKLSAVLGKDGRVHLVNITLGIFSKDEGRSLLAAASQLLISGGTLVVTDTFLKMGKFFKLANECGKFEFVKNIQRSITYRDDEPPFQLKCWKKK